MEISWINELFLFLEKVFPAVTISKGFQRGFIIAGIVLLYIGIYQLVRVPAGSFLFYRLRTGERVAQAASIADEVASIEGTAAGLEKTLELALAELKIRANHGLITPAQQNVSGVGVAPQAMGAASPLAPPLPAVISPIATQPTNGEAK